MYLTRTRPRAAERKEESISSRVAEKVLCWVAGCRKANRPVRGAVVWGRVSGSGCAGGVIGDSFEVWIDSIGSGGGGIGVWVVEFLAGGCLGGIRGGFAPMLEFGEGSAGSTLLDVGGDGECGDGEADLLPLAAAEAADGVAHHEEVTEVVWAEAGAAEVLCGAELALDRDSSDGIELIEDGGVVGGVRANGAATFEAGSGSDAHGRVECP